MAKCSVIKFKHLVDDNKLNAESFKPEYIEVIDLLLSLKTKRMLESVISILVNGDEIRTFVEEGLLYLRVSDMEPFFIKLYNVVKIPKNSKIKENIQLEEGDILISRSGTIGISAIVTSEIKNAVISSHIIRLSIKKDTINPYYLCAFLNSKYGFFQILKKSYGGVVPEISQDGIKKLIIFEPSPKFQTHIEQLVKQAYKKRKLAEQKYHQAEELLYKLLGITKEEIEKLEKEKGYETNFKNVADAFRFDAEYYHPKYLGIIELLKKSPFELKPLKKAVKISDEKVDPTNEENKTRKFRYVPIAKINESGEIFEWDEFYGWQAPSRARMLIRENDIIIPSLAGTFDKIALVPKELDRQLATTGCFVIRSKGDYPEFLFLLFRTPLFKRQLEQQTTGAIMSAVPKSVFGNLLIPKIPKNKQINIAKLVREYFELRKEARELIKQAIREVEKEIENASKSNRK